MGLLTEGKTGYSRFNFLYNISFKSISLNQPSLINTCSLGTTVSCLHMQDHDIFLYTRFSFTVRPTGELHY